MRRRSSTEGAWNGLHENGLTGLTVRAVGSSSPVCRPSSPGWRPQRRLVRHGRSRNRCSPLGLWGSRAPGRTPPAPLVPHERHSRGARGGGEADRRLVCSGDRGRRGNRLRAQRDRSGGRGGTGDPKRAERVLAGRANRESWHPSRCRLDSMPGTYYLWNVETLRRSDGQSKIIISIDPLTPRFVVRTTATVPRCDASGAGAMGR
jgi:hypothetical protein